MCGYEQLDSSDETTGQIPSSASLGPGWHAQARQLAFWVKLVCSGWACRCTSLLSLLSGSDEVDVPVLEAAVQDARQLQGQNHMKVTCPK